MIHSGLLSAVSSLISADQGLALHHGSAKKKKKILLGDGCKILLSYFHTRFDPLSRLVLKMFFSFLFFKVIGPSALYLL